MAGWHLDTKMAQDIVARTMRIIDTNINVMDARGRIIGSGDRERIGELHVRCIAGTFTGTSRRYR